MGLMDKVKGWFGGKQDQAPQGMAQSGSPSGETTGGSPGDQTMSTPDQPTDMSENPGDEA